MGGYYTLLHKRRTEKGHTKCNIMRQEGRWHGKRREEVCANSTSIWDINIRQGKINPVFLIHIAHVNISCSWFCFKVQNSSVRKLFSTSRRRGYSTWICSLYLSTHQRLFITADTSVYFVTLAINKLKLEYAVTSLLGADPHGRLQGYSLHFHLCGIFLWLLLKWETTESTSNKTWSMS